MVYLHHNIVILNNITAMNLQTIIIFNIFEYFSSTYLHFRINICERGRNINMHFTIIQLLL